MSSNNYHEPIELLRQETIEMHRAIVSLIEELEAVDWYQQRADACTDLELKQILIHHKDEEIEHAVMNLEWIRRRDAVFDNQCRAFLFSSKLIADVEKSKSHSLITSTSRTGEKYSTSHSLGIGSLKAARDKKEECDED